MITRKKKIRIVQLSLLFLGCLVLLFSYSFQNLINDKKIIQSAEKEIIEKKLRNNSSNLSFFYNIEYSGIDLSGNRFILNSQKAIANAKNQNLIDLEGVKATFYFKDNTELQVFSDFGEYNNVSLDIIFKNNVRALYVDTKLFADLANYSNLNKSLIISNNVKVIDKRGDLTADKLLFDIQSKTLNIQTFNENKINANLSTK